MDLILLIAGLVLTFKNKVRISSKRELAGRPVRILSVLYMLPFVAGYIIGAIAKSKNIQSLTWEIWVIVGLEVLAILTTLYFIFFYKTPQTEQPPSSQNLQ